jgi:hypothetical protein
MRLASFKILFACFLSMIMILAPTVSLASSTTTAAKRSVDFNIEYKGSEYDEENDVSIWRYEVSGTGVGPDLSHWVLGICANHEVVKASHTYESKLSKPDPTTGLEGIKFDHSIKVDETVQYWIMLKGNWETGQIMTAIKGGPAFVTQTVMGPTCEAKQVKNEDGAADTKDTDSNTKDTKANEDKNKGNQPKSKPIQKHEVKMLFPTSGVKWSASEKLKIHVKIDVNVKLKGKWYFVLGGREYVVKGGNEIRYEIKDAPVGSYTLSARFVSDQGNVTGESQPVVVHVSTEDGGTLPKTASPWYNLLSYGLVLASAGVWLNWKVWKYNE